MANQVTEGFDWFPSGKSSTERARLWAANSFFMPDSGNAMTYIPDVRTGRFGFGKAISWNNVSNPGGGNQVSGYVFPAKVTGDVLTDGWYGVSVFRGHDTTASRQIGVGFYDGVTGGINNGMQVYIEFGEFGVIRVWRGWPNGGGTVIGTSKMNAFQEDEWFNAEIYCKVANTGGQVQVRINTVIKVDIVSDDTQFTSVAGFDSLFMGEFVYGVFASNLSDFAYDDVFFNDASGSANNTWSGNLRVKTQFVTANGAHDDFSIGGTSPASTNWQSVLNQSLDDTKYVFSATPTNYDLYQLDPNLNAPIVRAVQVRMGLRQDDATQRSAKAIIRLGSTVYEDDVQHFTNQTYTFYKGIWDLNPATAVSFTGAEVNAMQAGVKVQS